MTTYPEFQNLSITWYIHPFTTFLISFSPRLLRYAPSTLRFALPYRPIPVSPYPVKLKCSAELQCSVSWTSRSIKCGFVECLSIKTDIAENKICIPKKRKTPVHWLLRRKGCITRIHTMGAGQSSSQNRLISQPEDIAEFRKLQVPTDYYVIPEVPQKRKVTDSKFLIVFGVAILILFPFLIYTLVNSDIDRFIHGYDNCGNVCGKKNTPVNGISCSGQDRSSKPILKYTTKNDFIEELDDTMDKECVESCDSLGYMQLFYLCFPSEHRNELDSNNFNKFLSEVGSDINKAAGYIVVLCLIGLGFAVGMLLLFRYFVAVITWVIIIGSFLGIVALTILFWIVDSNMPPEYKGGASRVFAIVFTIVSIISLIVIICMFKRIQLLIRLFKEAIKVIFGIPMILFEPLLTFVASAILVLIFIYLFILMETSGPLLQVHSSLYRYSPNAVMLFTIWYHLIICVWMGQFIVGCQHMVISGAVSAHYFSRDKSAMGSPIFNSFYNLLRYHLGTVAFGSLIVTIIAIVKALIKSLANNRQGRILVDCCLGAIEDFLKYLSKNAYILTAMHGQPFFKSGKRAVKLLAANAISAIAINSVGDFVLGMAKLLIVLCTVGVGILMYNSTDIPQFWAAIVISALVTALIADCFFAVFETAIDTIFLCFCEDSCMNDGMTRPYYMSVNLMQYIEEAKKTVKEKN